MTRWDALAQAQHTKKVKASVADWSEPAPRRATDVTLVLKATAEFGPIAEYRFHPERKWRLDVAWPKQKVALEVEGGAFSRGRHTRGKGFLGDMEKYNTLSSLGWRLFRCTPKEAESLECLRWVLPALQSLAEGNTLGSGG